MTLKLKETDYDLEQGFAWALYENELGEIFSLQACLTERKNKSETLRYIKAISKNDDGMNDGLCYDCNATLYNIFGYEYCVNILRKDLRKYSGIRFY